jgi:hypothetical protein
MRYVISVRAEAREQYVIEAESEDAAVAIYKTGNVAPRVAEVYDPEIVRVDSVDKESLEVQTEVVREDGCPSCNGTGVRDKAICPDCKNIIP